MKIKVFKGILLIAMMSAMLVTVSCQKKQTEETTPTAPVAAVEESEPAAAPEVSVSGDAERRELEEARQAFMAEDINFAFDDSSLSATAQEILQRKAAWMRDNPDEAVVVEGHCDERGTTEYNIALGDRRAQSAKAFLVDLGIESSRLSTVSYGEEMPVDPRQTEDAYAKNRRAHFTIK
ncbi:MAG: peptidoglycan-associated lipoprotein Pal [Thermodesulfobacteriota bacterium]